LLQFVRNVERATGRILQSPQADNTGLDDKQRARILALARDFPALWNDPRTPDWERKRMARLLIADVTLLKGTNVRAQIRFNGGKTHTLHAPLPNPSWMVRQTPAAVVAEIDRLLNDHTDGEVADEINSKGLTSGNGLRYNTAMVVSVCHSYKLKSRYQRLRARHLLTLPEIAKRLKIKPHTVIRWRRAGLLVGHPYDDHSGECRIK
jgi:hypothetical protein